MGITKLAAAVFLSVLIIFASISSIYIYYQLNNTKKRFFFGVTYGQNTVEEAKLLIDKVKDYTNLLIINSYPITINNTTPQVLNEICDYATTANLHFIVYFFSFHPRAGPWQQEWLDTAKQKWGEKFLGIYLRDEPGGRQIELAGPEPAVKNAANYSDAADSFVGYVSSTFSVQFLNGKGVPIFTSDFALYWFDYQAGYNVIFAELGWNNSRTREIALCRGAANMLNKDWGTIITWTYNQPPYLASGSEIYQDMVDSYTAGAKYVVVFDYPQYPEDNQYGILTDEHFSAMEQFWDYATSHPREEKKTEAAYLLPKDYGWGMRNQNDKIWGIWETDDKAPIIWENLNKLETKYGLNLDIIYDDPRYNSEGKYHQIYQWNATIN
jgi:hypothetical protein